MSQIGRLSGAVLVKEKNRFFLVGDLKEPCDFAKHGFESPGEIEPLKNPYVELKPNGRQIDFEPEMVSDIKTHKIGQVLYQRFSIRRNGSISERLWDLVLDNSQARIDGKANINWLLQVPDSVWEAVRDSVLRCV